MKAQSKGSALCVAVLMAVAAAIILLGVGFGIYALIDGVTFSVMSTQIPGVVFAAVVAFLGVRFFLAALKLAKKVRGGRFSWGNFKKQSAKGNI
jgi:hypothetical protein